MSVSLSKGGNVSLTKEAPGLPPCSSVSGWDARTTTGADFDLDASALMVGTNGKVLSDSHFVFFNNLTSPDGSVEHTGDNLTGEGEGDDEAIKVNLAACRPRSTRSSSRCRSTTPRAAAQSFGQVRNAFIRVVNQADNAELARYDLSEDASTETAMIFGELYRNGAEWKFRAVGQGYSTGLRGHRPRLRRQRRLSRDVNCVFLRTFGGSLVVAVVGLVLGYLYGGGTGLALAAILAVLEVSLSLRQRGRQRDRAGADEPVLAEDLPDRRRGHRRVRHAAGLPAAHRRHHREADPGRGGPPGAGEGRPRHPAPTGTCCTRPTRPSRRSAGCSC